MRICFKLPVSLLAAIKSDLARPHPFAHERVGFLACRVGGLKPSGLVILASRYLTVTDSDYVEDDTVGAMMGPAAIRKALEFAYNNPVSMFHVHLHNHLGQPGFSDIDLKESAKFVPNFWHVRPAMPHGAVVLSKNSAWGLCWYSEARRPLPMTEFIFVGTPMRLVRSRNEPPI